MVNVLLKCKQNLSQESQIHVNDCLFKFLILQKVFVKSCYLFDSF